MDIYHLINRGVDKRKIFVDKQDHLRFIHDLFEFNNQEKVNNTYYSFRQSINDVRRHYIETSRKARKTIIDLLAFCLMPNHYHILVSPKVEGAISLFMKKVNGGYAKYFNAKYNMSGHVFQGAYNAVHIEDNNQLLYVSTYVHRNPRELRGWKNREGKYPWSSFLDYITANRWGNLIKQDIILDQFPQKVEYEKFVNESVAKNSSDL